MQGPPSAGFNIGALGGLAPGTYIDGVQQTVFNSIGGLGNNALAAGYQATINNSYGSTSTITLVAPANGNRMAMSLSGHCHAGNLPRLAVLGST
jgi:hypothetical protein